MGNSKGPETLVECIRMFSDPDFTFEFFRDIRWPDGPKCVFCGSARYSFLSTRKLFKCKDCGKQYSVKKGTIFEDSPLGLDKWMTVVWLVANAKNGISSYEIERAIKLDQKCAWHMLHRIRLAMKTGTFEKLGGTVEADESFLGGKAKNMHPGRRREVINGRGPVGKVTIFGMIERGGEVRAMSVPDRKRKTLQQAVRSHAEFGCTLYTDALASYMGLDTRYSHEIIDHAYEYVRDDIHTNSIENFWSLFKRCIKGTYVAIAPQHVDAYLDEEVFRFNERRMDDGQRFRTLLGQVSGKRLQWSELISRGNCDD